MKKSLFFTMLFAVCAISCNNESGLERGLPRFKNFFITSENLTIENAGGSSSDTRVHVIEEEREAYLFWSDGDIISINGLNSDPLQLNGEEINIKDASKFQFTFNSEIDVPTDENEMKPQNEGVLFDGMEGDVAADEGSEDNSAVGSDEELVSEEEKLRAWHEILTPPYHAAYPATTDIDFVYFPTEQYYVSDNIADGTVPMRAYSETSNLNMTFVGIIMQIALYGEGYAISQIKLESDDKISGKFRCDFDSAVGKYTTTPTEDAVSYVVFSAGKEGVALSDEYPTYFWISLPAGAYDMKVTMTATNGDEMKARTKFSSRPAAPGRIRRFMPVTFYPNSSNE